VSNIAQLKIALPYTLELTFKTRNRPERFPSISTGNHPCVRDYEFYLCKVSS